jgi:hypothetical protein
MVRVDIVACSTSLSESQANKPYPFAVNMPVLHGMCHIAGLDDCVRRRDARRKRQVSVYGPIRQRRIRDEKHLRCSKTIVALRLTASVASSSDFNCSPLNAFAQRPLRSCFNSASQMSVAKTTTDAEAKFQECELRPRAVERPLVLKLTVHDQLPEAHSLFLRRVDDIAQFLEVVFHK